MQSSVQNTSNNTANKYWKPGNARPPRQQSSSVVDRQDNTSENVDLYQHSSMSIAQHRRNLPIAAYRTHILYLLEKYRTIIIIGQTGNFYFLQNKANRSSQPKITKHSENFLLHQIL